MLYRFREAMLIEAGLKRNPNDPNPLLPETCDRLPIAEQARRDLIKEISKKITKIQDKGLDETQIRQMNDELNELVRRKHAWDHRILQLGGIQRRSVQVADKLGIEAPSIQGYFYFGRAKELPGVQEALNPRQEEQTSLAKKKQELLSKVNHEYYGFGEEEDSELLEAERKAEMELADFEGPLIDWVTGLPTVLPKGLSISSPPDTIPPKHVPSQEEVQHYLLQRRKAALLRKLDHSDN